MTTARGQKLLLAVDLFNIFFLVVEHCSADANSSPESCFYWLAGTGFTIVVVAICFAIAEWLGIRASQEPQHKRRRQAAMDGLRVAGLAANLQKIRGLCVKLS
jgi:hypothetical protein